YYRNIPGRFSHLDELRFELAQEAHIIFRKQPQVLDFIFQIGNTLNTHTERKTAVPFAVNAAILQNIGINHTASQYFHPSGTLAHIATVAFTDGATDIHFCGRLREREVRWAETHLGALT